MSFKKKKNHKSHEIAPDEIFLDASNLPDYNTHQFEGRLEKPIARQALVFLGFFFMLVGGVFIWKLLTLQIVEDEKFRALAENNRLEQTLIFAKRGVVFDRNGKELVWNEPFNVIYTEQGQDAQGELPTDKERKEFAKRRYIRENGFAHVLGYVKYPQKDASGFYYKEEIVGEEGIERSLNDILGGQNGLELVETDAFGEVQSHNTAREPKNGANIALTLDWRIQNKLYGFIQSVAREAGFTGGSGVIMDITNGELITLTSFPEYDSEVLSSGGDRRQIQTYVKDVRKPFLNRAVAGLYAPGSIVKTMIALGALEEGIVAPDDEILSTGSIAVPHPYFPGRESVFLDWKAHGLVNLVEALAVSSNVYFYEIGGGFEERVGLGIKRIEKYIRMFGLGEETGIALEGEESGVVPNPEWKEETFADEWRVGDTYNTAIGQYGFQITPLQAVRAVAAIANKGTLVGPRLVQEIDKNESESGLGNVLNFSGGGTVRRLLIKEEHFDVVHEGMRRAVTEGTAQGLYLAGIPSAAKTGTAQVGIAKKFVHSWIIGFFPYEKPRYAFAVVMEHGPEENLIGALYVMRQLLEWMAVNTPEYFGRQ